MVSQSVAATPARQWKVSFICNGAWRSAGSKEGTQHDPWQRILQGHGLAKIVMKLSPATRNHELMLQYFPSMPLLQQDRMDCG
jgi:hypothetical protein